MKLNQAAWIKAEGKRREIQQRYAQDHDEGAACEALRKVSAKAPDLPAVLNDLVFFALRVCEGDVARQAARHLLRAAPENPAAVDRAAEALNSLGHRDEALSAWQRLLRTPHRVQAMTALALGAERRHRMPEARDWISQALTASPRDAGTLLAAASITRRDGNPAAALDLLQPLLATGVPPAWRYRAWYLAGDLLDALDDPPAAAAAWQEAKRSVQSAYPRETAACRQQHLSLQARRQRILAGLTPERLARWRAVEPPLPPKPLAVLIGHPRSGTTLLEQVLAAHPAVVDIDEKNALAVSVKEAIFRAHPSPDEWLSLEAAGASDLAAARRDYYRRVASLKPLAADSLILDKNPNLTDFAPFLLRPFPELRILTARRDPRDIVLSCYRQAVPPDYANISWLEPASLAADCQAMLQGWERLRDALGPHGGWLEVSYEKLCLNFPATAREATEFLGLAWHPDQENYRHTQAGKHVASPTYADVRVPVHTGAIGRWKRYAELIPDLFTPWRRD